LPAQDKEGDIIPDVVAPDKGPHHRDADPLWRLGRDGLAEEGDAVI
jgi:hypothetical protein